MYSLINQLAQTLVGTIPPDHESLLNDVAQANIPQYQTRYRDYWVMNAARLSSTFYGAYFSALRTATGQTPTLSSLLDTLHAASTRSDGKQSLQVSFATKLLHMKNLKLPIYSSEVTAFYFFQEPSADVNRQQRISEFVAFHNFLIHEYARVLRNNLLATAIQEFRLQLNPQLFTDEKIVDSLIWAFVRYLWKGALPAGQVVYS
jgi:hypothetical protein